MIALKLVRSIRKRIASRPVMSVLCLVVLVYLAATLSFVVYERMALGEATTVVVPAFLGELGVVESRSVTSKVGLLASLIASVAFVAIITAKLTTMFIEVCNRGGSVMKRVRCHDHIVIAGWNFQGERIVSELLRSEVEPRREVVILADCEKRPMRDERVEFVRGDPTQREDLIRAGIERANSAIILSDLTKSPNEADAEALMTILAVETVNRGVHSCVQIMNSANRVHLERAHADEIICLDQLGGNLAVASALNHGTSRVVTELLTFSLGSEFYRCDLDSSSWLIGKEFSDAVRELAAHGVIPLGFETDDTEELRERLKRDVLQKAKDGERVTVVNPQGRHTIRPGDALFLVAEKAPNGLLQRRPKAAALA